MTKQIAGLCAMVAVFAVGCAPTSRSIDAPIEISLEQGDRGQWTLIYEFPEALVEVDFGPTLDGFRHRDWALETPGLVLEVQNDRDLLRSNNRNGEISSVRFSVRANSIDVAKDYQMFVPIGADGWLLYTGYLISSEQRASTDLVLSFKAVDGYEVTAFGETKNALTDWRSPFDHPAFIYFGPRKVTPTDRTIVIDERAPKWIKDTFASFVPDLFVQLQLSFDRALTIEPDFFMSFENDGMQGRLKFSGDALPGQFRITLTGAGWETQSPEAIELLRGSTAHEAAHLWQAAARPANDDVPDWIHEGAADAIAVETLVSIGVWTKKDARTAFENARKECAELLVGRTMQRAVRDGTYRVSYACGHVLNVAAAGEGRVTDFWRSLIAESQQDGYDTQLFLTLARRRGGDDLAAGIERFSRINNARPDIAIQRVLDLAP